MAPSVRTMSFPPRLARDGGFATVEQDGDDHVAELLVAGILTRPGERHLVPGFGIDGPEFVGWEQLKLALHVNDFGPPIILEGVEVSVDGRGTERVTMSWRRPETWESSR